ncbi:MAG: circularly permuted type 2 ATP-grasp protein [Planctomyces sp.]|nr:circularly permuted type 2 ATP-grasp protein [Planctomyces sp.]
MSKNHSLDLTPFELVPTRQSERLLNSSAAPASKVGNHSAEVQSQISLQAAGETVFPVTGNSFQRLEADRISRLSSGLKQRFDAINAFFNDVLTNGNRPAFLNRCPIAAQIVEKIPRSVLGMRPSGGAWTWMESTDLFIHQNGEPILLDHNFACPVGLHRLHELIENYHGNASIVSNWLSGTISSQCRSGSTPGKASDGGGKSGNPPIAILDAGTFSPALRENEFIAECAGGSLIRNRDLLVRPDGLYIILQGRMQKLDVLIRRIDDDLLDPNCFRPDSLIGVPGLVRLCRNGGARVMNTPGTGLIGNRAIAALIPEMIRHYLRETPELRSVPTLLCGNLGDRDVILGDLNNFAVRTIDPLHPARPFFGSTATATEKSDLTARLLKDPRNYVARPLLPKEELHVCGGFNLRVFSSCGQGFSLLPAGIGRPAQPDGGATLAVVSDPTAFAVSLEG